jgi:hypothetical protein
VKRRAPVFAVRRFPEPVFYSPQPAGASIGAVCGRAAALRSNEGTLLLAVLHRASPLVEHECACSDRASLCARGGGQQRAKVMVSGTEKGTYLEQMDLARSARGLGFEMKILNR